MTQARINEIRELRARMESRSWGEYPDLGPDIDLALDDLLAAAKPVVCAHGISKTNGDICGDCDIAKGRKT